ncbi:MAG: hypothetical protein V3T83_15545 [Acidobacteriota bacterium]
MPEEKDGLIERFYDALIWCSASGDFAPGGEARKGWLEVCQPLLDEIPGLPDLHSPQNRRRRIELKSRIATPGLSFEEQMKAMEELQSLARGDRPAGKTNGGKSASIQFDTTEEQRDRLQDAARTLGVDISTVLGVAAVQLLEEFERIIGGGELLARFRFLSDWDHLNLMRLVVSIETASQANEARLRGGTDRPEPWTLGSQEWQRPARQSTPAEDRPESGAAQTLDFQVMSQVKAEPQNTSVKHSRRRWPGRRRRRSEGRL